MDKDSTRVERLAHSVVARVGARNAGLGRGCEVTICLRASPGVRIGVGHFVRVNVKARTEPVNDMLRAALT
jgi:hypothetical protein